MTVDPRHKSRVLLDGPDRAPVRSYSKAVGFTDEDLSRPLVGVAHCWIGMAPCNWNQRKLEEKVKEGIRAAGGTGGMLAEAQNYLREHHPEAKLFVYGQDYNKRAFATAASDMLMKQVDHNGGGDLSACYAQAGNIRFGDSFTEDRFAGETFD